MSIRHNETHQKICEIQTNIDYFDKKTKNLVDQTTNNNKSLNKVQNDMFEVNNKIVECKTDLRNLVNKQWEDTLALNDKLEEKIIDLNMQTEKSNKLSKTNNTQIKLIQSALTDVELNTNENILEIKKMTQTQSYIEGWLMMKF
jgi:hypothetical protein